MQRFTRALVTGASTGIGAAIASELATRGTELVVVARSADQLEALAEQWRAAHGVDVEVLPADLTDPGQLERVEDRLRTEDAAVDLLVNNAGWGSTGAFIDSTPDEATTCIELNVTALTRLTHAVLPRLVAAGHGGVLNVSSVGGFQPVPHFAVYAATKAYVSSFTEAVHEELRGSGVHVTALCPGFTRSDFVTAAGAEDEAARIPDFLWQDVEPVACAGVDGVSRGRGVVVSGALNQVTTGLSSVTPSTVSRRVVAGVINRFT
ncbi:SDR family NAD(P)-dependent oxidoreductase [Nitriliruptor alkaliphilus]|uniref:SDR family NAD(P)-dependent oxidoreductase n=1 Tax=Nitriliruptor alkaliphilus TaxID=427918 RepID=UPI000697128D|nr:SDR family oxidoreductase [Nitriliruptor alkaliphilus]